MKDSRNTPKALSALTLLMIGTASAGAAFADPATEATQAQAALGQATSIASLDDLSMAEFEATARASNLEALAGGHHDDSIGSHHHHDVAIQSAKAVAATRFNV